ncbi:MAG: sigma factor-like helix-turn-helix DNA-binding protein [Nanoarchaeota archaeon]
MDKIDSLNRILKDILINGKDKYDELFNHEYIKKKVNGVAKKFHENTGFDKFEIRNIARIIIFKELKNNKFKIDEEQYIVRDFLAKLNSMLYLRLNDYNDELRLEEKDPNDKKVINVDIMEIPIEVFDENKIEKDFTDDVVDKIALKDFVDELSTRETQVFYFIFLKDFTQEKTANELNIARETVYVYKERILEKFESYVNNVGY